MIKTTPLQNALLAALLGSVALVGCKKKEDTADNNAQPAASTPADQAAPAPMTGAPPPMSASATAVNVSAVSVGKSAAADKSVAATALFAPKDDIIVSVRTDGAASNTSLAAKLTFQDGQVAGEQTQALHTTGADTTNITFKNAKGWPAGKYRAEVSVDGKAAGAPQEFEVK